MAHYLTFATLAEADAHVRALGRSRAFTSGGRPPLPRCDDLVWGDPAIKKGRHVVAPNPCPTRDRPVDGCPYVTWFAAEVIRLPDDTFGVQVGKAHERAGTDVRSARALTDVELDDATHLRGDRADALLRRGRG